MTAMSELSEVSSSAGAGTPDAASAAPRFDPTTALVVVDMQNDFADPGGSLYVKGGDQIVPFVNSSIAAAQAAGALIVYTRDWHPEHTPHFARDGGVWPVHCVRETWGAAFPPELVVAGEVVLKGTGGEEGYSGFSVRDLRAAQTKPTELEGLLRRRGIRKLVIVGLATDWCVEATALDARRLGFEVTVDTRGTRAVELHEGDGQRAIERMRAAGVQIT
jgi:nicotinamidase/pyrazinamidase